MSDRTCVFCRHVRLHQTGDLGCAIETSDCPVTGIERIRICDARRSDPMDQCGPKGKLFVKRRGDAKKVEQIKAMMQAESETLQ